MIGIRGIDAIFDVDSSRHPMERDYEEKLTILTLVRYLD